MQVHPPPDVSHEQDGPKVASYKCPVLSGTTARLVLEPSLVFAPPSSLVISYALAAVPDDPDIALPSWPSPPLLTRRSTLYVYTGYTIRCPTDSDFVPSTWDV